MLQTKGLKMSYSIPILILTFNRPTLVESQINRLRSIRPDLIFIASDGPRLNRLDDANAINECRKIIDREIDWPCTVYKKFEDTNLGCGLGVSSAITWFFDHVEAGIILEDDCMVSNCFFDLCANLLDRHKYDLNIAGIGADFKFLKNNLPENNYGFISFPQIWGWATWRRVWQEYRFNLNEANLSNTSWLDDFPQASKDYWKENFNKIINNKIDTWDYQFAYLVLSNKMKFIHPMRNMVSNLGFGESATHTRSKYDDTSSLPIYEVNGPFIENNKYKNYDYFLKNHYFIKKSILKKLLAKIKIRIFGRQLPMHKTNNGA